jgi:hypothetical protein
MPVIGMFLIAGLHKNIPRAYLLIFLGLAMLAVSMIADTLDEVVDLPGWYNFVFEGFFQVLGFLLVLGGLQAWVRWNKILNLNLNELATTDFLTGAFNRRHLKRSKRAAIVLSKQIDQVQHTPASYLQR